MRESFQINDGNAFYSPFPSEILVKADEEGGKWNVYLQASNETEDQQGEKVLQKALEEQKNFFLSHGILSWDHQHRMTNDPNFIIGEPTDVSFTSKNETLVKGFLYKENKVAQGVFQNLMSQSSRFGASIGGYVLHKGKGNVIDRIYWSECAITHKPVNDGTLGTVSVIPFKEFAKALMAGSGVNAAEYTGGRALTPEVMKRTLFNIVPGLDKQTKEVRTSQEATDCFNDVWLGIQLGQIHNKEEMCSYLTLRGYNYETSEAITNFIVEHLPEVEKQLSVPTGGMKLNGRE